RVKAQFRRIEVYKAAANSSNGTPEITEISFGEVKVDFKTYRALRGKEEIILSAKEFELLRFLVSQPDVPVTRNELLDNVWGYNSYPTTRTVDNFIARLRNKIEEVPDK